VLECRNLAVALPEFDIFAVDELFRGFNCGGIIGTIYLDCFVGVAFNGLAGCCCGMVAKRRPIFQPGKRGSDLLWRLGEMKRRYKRARGCRGSSSLNPLIVVSREV
jgi:hypothetical protein